MCTKYTIIQCVHCKQLYVAYSRSDIAIWSNFSYEFQLRQRMKQEKKDALSRWLARPYIWNVFFDNHNFKTVFDETKIIAFVFRIIQSTPIITTVCVCVTLNFNYQLFAILFVIKTSNLNTQFRIREILR